METHQSKDHHKLTVWQWLKKHKDIWNIAVLFAVWRGILELFAEVGKAHFSFLSPGSPWDDRVTEMITNWTRWDSGWYLTIVEQGYQWITPAEGAANVAFFPLYPMLVNLLSFPLESNPFVVMTMVSAIACLVSLVYFYKLVLLDHSRETAYRALTYLLLFPFSFFLISGYTESIFFLFVVASMYHARKSEWLTAGIFGFFASATRFVGFALVFVIILEYLRQKRWRIKDIKADIGFAFLAPLGLFSYMYLLKTKFDNSLLFFHAQEAWGRATAWPVTTITNDYWPLVTNAARYADRLELSMIMDFFYFGIGSLLVVLSFIFLRQSYAWFALIAFIPAISSGTLDSIGRYMLVIFPFFILLAIAGKWKPFNIAYLTLAGFFLAYNVILFVNWNWVA